MHDFVDQTLCNNQPPFERIRRFLHLLLEESTQEVQHRGCLLVNTLLESPAEDEEIIRHASAGLRYVEGRFSEVLEEMKLAGELAPEVDCTARARLLKSGIFGLRVWPPAAAARGDCRDSAGDRAGLMGSFLRQEEA